MKNVGQPWLRTYDAHEGPVQDRIWIENNPGKFDGIAERENRICLKGVARRHCPYNPKLGCDCGYRKADNG